MARNRAAAPRVKLPTVEPNEVKAYFTWARASLALGRPAPLYMGAYDEPTAAARRAEEDAERERQEAETEAAEAAKRKARRKAREARERDGQALQDRIDREAHRRDTAQMMEQGLTMLGLH